jgi:hypothetical protein
MVVTKMWSMVSQCNLKDFDHYILKTLVDIWIDVVALVVLGCIGCCRQ